MVTQGTAYFPTACLWRGSFHFSEIRLVTLHIWFTKKNQLH